MFGSALSRRVLFCTAIAAFVINSVTVGAWPQHRSSSQLDALTPKKISTRRISLQSDRRNVLQKVIAAGCLSIVGSGTEARAIATASSGANKKVYNPPSGSLNGKVVVITGGTTGLGLESAKRLAAAGGTIVLTARTDSKGAKAIRDVQQYLDDKSVGTANIYAITLNLDDLDSVKSFPQRYTALLGSKKIDVLMNNAGVAAIPEREVTKDGFERTFQTNHLGPFGLTALLFPYLNREGSRVINVSSYAHEFATLAKSGKSGLDIHNLNGEVDYSGLGWPAYCRSKLENILFTRELQRRADAAGLDWLTATALHPGRVATDIWRTTYFGIDQRGERKEGAGGGNSFQSIVSDLFYTNVLPVEEGANTQVMLAASGEQQGTLVKGQYFDERMRLKKLNAFARDDEKARYLWNRSQELTGIKFLLN